MECSLQIDLRQWRHWTEKSTGIYWVILLERMVTQNLPILRLGKEELMSRNKSKMESTPEL